MKKLGVLLLLLCSSTVIFSQTALKISYNEKIKIDKIDPNTIFNITGNSLNTKLKGNAINDFVFEKPGDYTINVQSPTTNHDHGDSCEHTKLPNSFSVQVSPYKIVFDTATISFSDVIRKNKNANGLVLNIAVTVETYNHKKAIMNPEIVKSAGIGTNIIATLDQKFAMLNEGTHTISYNLSGTATENAYIMFDFVEPNGNIQSVALLKPIEN